MLNDLLSQKILVVDDEAGIRDGLKASLEQMGYDVETAESGERALHRLKNSTDISFVVSDYRMPGLSGFDVLKDVKKNNPHVKVIMMTGHGSIHHAVEAMHLGADDYLTKPFRVEDLDRIIEKNSPHIPAVTTAAIVTQDQNFISILTKAERAAKSNAPILIEGPSGTGKELLARQIHEWSPRQDKPWVAVNCAALPGGLLESELFGYEKGAFTGAMDRKPGRFEQAHGGTLLLDEIGELDPLLQAKLLRVLQEGEIDRLGGRKPLKVDVRIIATTNKNLEQLVYDGKFREDLYFRLYGVRFNLPALKNRRGDIGLIAEEFLRRQSAVQGQNLQFGEGVVEALSKRSWNGNIRELERAVERAAVLSDSGIVQLAHFEFEDRLIQSSAISAASKAPVDSSNRSIKEMEKEIILKALASHGGNRTHTAKSLGMSLRTLRHKLKSYREAGDDVAEYSPTIGTGQKSLGSTLPILPFDSALSASPNGSDNSNGGRQFA